MEWVAIAFSTSWPHSPWNSPLGWFSCHLLFPDFPPMPPVTSFQSEVQDLLLLGVCGLHDFPFCLKLPCKLIHNHKTQPAPLRRCLQVRCTVQQQSPSFSQQGPVSWKTTFPQMWWWEGWFGDYSRTLHVLCTLFLLLLHQLHLGPSGIRSQRLRTTAIEDRVHSGERHAWDNI